MQKQEKKFSTGHESNFWIKHSFGIRHPPPIIKCSVYVWGRAQGSQIFKRNSIISIRSKVMAFLVILLSPWSPWSPRCPRGPCVIPVIPTSSPLSPHHPHSPQKVPMWSPSSPWSPLSPLSPSMLSPLSPHHPCRPHIIPTSSRRSPDHSQPSDSHPTHLPLPWGGGGSQITKNATRFELIKIF